MKGLLLTFLLLTFVYIAIGQGKYDANWVFGVKAGINFSDTSSPTNLNTLCNNYNAAVSISDSLGTLLYYVAPDTPFRMNGALTASYSVFNQTNLPIANGKGLYVGARLHNAIFLPMPNSENEFLLFYMQTLDSIVYDTAAIPISGYEFDKLCYARIKHGVIDSLVKKNIILDNAAIEWRMAAVKHANGKDWWLMLHSYNKGITTDLDTTYLRFLITSDTILGPLSQNIGYAHSYSLNGQSAFNSSGTRFVSALNGDSHAEVFNFDRCTGLLSNFLDLNIGNASSVLGAEFSKVGNQLYLSETLNGLSSKNRIYQYSLDSPVVSQTMQIIWEDSIFNNSLFNFGRMARAPNNKIYLSVASGPSAPYPYNYYNAYNQNLWVINNPDSFGTACNFQPLAYYLGDSARSYYSLPNMPNYNLGPISIYAANAGKDTMLCKEQNTGVTLGSPSLPGLIYHWQSSSTLSDTTIAQPLATPNIDTYYILTVTDTSYTGSSCSSNSDTVFVSVHSCCDTSLLAKATAGKDTSFCNNDSTIKGVFIGDTAITGITYTWQAAPEIDSVHKSIQLVHPPQSRWYYVTFSDSIASCSREDSVYVMVKICNGIDEIGLGSINVYPNPAADNLVVEMPIAHEAVFILYDIVGHSLLSIPLRDTKTFIDVSALPQGLYIYCIGDVAGKVQVVR